MHVGLASKAFYMIGEPIDGIITDKNGDVYRPYQSYVEHMIVRGYATNSINSYAEHTFRFLNYVARAIELTPPPINKSKLRLIVLTYTSYLLHGTDAPDPVTSQIAVEQNKVKRLSSTHLRQLIMPFLISLNWVNWSNMSKLVKLLSSLRL